SRAGSQTLPGSLVGSPDQASVTLPEYYTATNTDYVDPRTGAILDVTETQKLTLEDATGVQRLLLFNGTVAMTPQSVQAAVNLDQAGRSKLILLKVVLPIVAGVGGPAPPGRGGVPARPPAPRRPPRPAGRPRRDEAAEPVPAA